MTKITIVADDGRKTEHEVDQFLLIAEKAAIGRVEIEMPKSFIAAYGLLKMAGILVDDRRAQIAMQQAVSAQEGARLVQGLLRKPPQKP